VQGLAEDGEFDDVVCIPVPEPSSELIRSKGTGNIDNDSRNVLFWLLLQTPIPPQVDSIIVSAGNRLATPVSGNKPNTAVNARKNVENVRDTVRIQVKVRFVQRDRTVDLYYRSIACQHLQGSFFRDF